MKFPRDGNSSVICSTQINFPSAVKNPSVHPCHLRQKLIEGTGSNHIREKDGLWAIVAWLNIIAAVDSESSSPGTTTIGTILQDFWTAYGRTFFSRYDYENIDSAKAQKVVDKVTRHAVTENKSFIGTDLGNGLVVADAGDFEYTDPVDGSVSRHQGIYFKFEEGSRIVVRLSGTGSEGATIRLYIEKYETVPPEPLYPPFPPPPPYFVVFLGAMLMLEPGPEQISS